MNRSGHHRGYSKPNKDNSQPITLPSRPKSKDCKVCVDAGRDGKLWHDSKVYCQNKDCENYSPF